MQANAGKNVVPKGLVAILNSLIPPKKLDPIVKIANCMVDTDIVIV
jgi:hypothetical protein